MSLMTTQPEMLTSVPPVSKGWGLAGGSDDYTRDGAGSDGWRIERRRNRSSGDSPMDVLTRLPAVAVLERISVKTLAMTRDGIILFANTAFAEMVGYEQDRLAGLAFPEIFRTLPAEVAALSGVEALANLVVQLRHCEGWTVRARMSRSALMRRDDRLVLVMFDNLTERLWMDEG
jgi:PAS domain S-box-containing protein